MTEPTADARGEIQPENQPDDPSGEPSTDGPQPVRFRDFGRAGPLAVVSAFAPAAGGFILLGFMPTVTRFLYGLGMWGDLLYVAGFALSSGFAFLPTYAQSALGGYTYGFAGGVAGAITGIVGGSLIGYAAARRLAGDDANEVIEGHPKWRAVRDAFVAHTNEVDRLSFWRTLGIVILIRFPPNSPFALTNLLMASVRVPLVPYVVGTAIGILPRTALLVLIGWLVQGQITSEAVKDARPGWLFPLGIALTIGVLVLLAWLGDKAVRRAVARGEIPAEEAEADTKPDEDQPRD